MEVVSTLSNNHPGWKAGGAYTDENAWALFNQLNFDVVLMGGGVRGQSIELLTNKFKDKNPSVKIVNPYGGGSGLLFNEIQEALNYSLLVCCEYINHQKPTTNNHKYETKNRCSFTIRPSS